MFYEVRKAEEIPHSLQTSGQQWDVEGIGDDNDDLILQKSTPSEYSIYLIDCIINQAACPNQVNGFGLLIFSFTAVCIYIAFELANKCSLFAVHITAFELRAVCAVHLQLTSRQRVAVMKSSQQCCVSLHTSLIFSISRSILRRRIKIYEHF